MITNKSGGAMAPLAPLVPPPMHIRVAEFLSSTKQRMTSEKGTAFFAGQNLRDELLTNHNNLSSHASY